MRVKRFGRLITGGIVIMCGGVYPALAQADPISASPVPTPLVAIFAVAFIAAAALALFYSYKVRGLTTQNNSLRDELALRDSASWLRQEHAILWPFDKDTEIVFPGFASALDIEKSEDNQYAAFLNLLQPEDTEALAEAVRSLRHDRRPFLLTVSSSDLTRTFSVRGDSIVANASGAALLLVSDRTVEAARVERLSTDAAQMYELLDALPIPVWLRDEQRHLKYVNQS